MKRILAVTGVTEKTKEMLREAGSIAEGTGADIVVLHVTTGDEYSARREAMESLSSGSTGYTSDEARKGAAEFAGDIADEVLSEFDVEYESAGAVGDKATKTLEAADEHDCDHIFLVGRRRSPTGKAVFGDASQRIILQSDGYVTITTE